MFRTSGCLIWQLNDCWPVIGWSLIDYGLNPKPSYFFVKSNFRPIIAPLIIRNGKTQVYIINETNEILEATLDFEIMNFTGETSYSKKIEVNVPAFTSELAIENPMTTMTLHDNSIFVVTLESKGKLLYQDIKPVREPKDLKLPIPNIKSSIRKAGPRRFILRLQSDVYAKAVSLNFEGLKVQFNDNFFDLLPKKAKTIKYISEQDLNLEEYEEKFSLETYPYSKRSIM